MGCVHLAVMVLGLLVMAQHSSQLISKTSLHLTVQRINEQGGPYLGLLLITESNEIALQASGFFVSSSDVPFLDLAGRRFHIGKIKGVDVICVKAGDKTVNAAITVQMLVDNFNVQGIVHYGRSGSVNASLYVGDVVVPEFFTFAASWDWKPFNIGRGGEMNFGDFNYPEEGENLLGSMDFEPVELYSTGEPTMQKLFWFPAYSNWLKIAVELQGLELQQCVNATTCLPTSPKIVTGVRAASTDMLVNNAAYGKFLFEQLKVSTVDQGSAAIALTCLSNGVPFVVFRGVWGYVGAEETERSLGSLASVNALKAAAEFIGAVGSGSTSAASGLTS